MRRTNPNRPADSADAVSERRDHRDLVAEWSASADPQKTDERISAALIPLLWALYGDSDQQVREHLIGFRRANRRQLSFIQRQHADDPRVAPLLRQPELPLILDRLEADPTGLIASWPVTVPRIWLEALAEAWGRPF